MSGTLTVEERGNVLLATIDNPPHALLDAAIHMELAALARRADEDPDVGAVVLTGAHPSRFVAHFDVSLVLANAESSPPMSPKAVHAALKAVGAALRVPGAQEALRRSPAAGLAVMERMRQVSLGIERCAAVWIAALNGHVGGGGCELALACDMRLMADGDHCIAQPEIFLGFPPGGGGTQRLTRLLGRAAALRLCLDGGPLSPKEALDIGLVDEVVDPDLLVERAVEVAARLGRRPKAAIGAIKRSVNIGGSLPLVDGLRLEAAEFLSAITTPEAITAMKAYAAATEELGDLPASDPRVVDEVLERGRFA
ncbi:enoyl-CoA hydratase/isomerase family protein [Streptomyces sp. XD-27]|uniref:enoyl-CoA hydratase/isomerase family protein n=1 Tax=Streptomyces sp. XD-27 TaxID=3062779 RepID=UPI0026F46FFA|nr:enoyl-CoA hydratase/isomerase family protein [Streptomyces sp. XD-27]WKX73579.1 enoyl-CoA hydratase/isomerase family protein [Streptomyces sp. XD-27]